MNEYSVGLDVPVSKILESRLPLVKIRILVKKTKAFLRFENRVFCHGYHTTNEQSVTFTTRDKLGIWLKYNQGTFSGSKIACSVTDITQTTSTNEITLAETRLPLVISKGFQPGALKKGKPM
jgi:hypothetical protein